MSTKRDYYEILGIAKSASVDEIKRAYRSLALKHHPDRVSSEQKKEAEERFKEISEAYAILSDPEKRKLYDAYGHAGIDSRFSQQDIFRGADFSSIFGDSGFGSIFDDLLSGFGFDVFGGGPSGVRSGRRRARRGGDVQAEVTLTLEEVLKGVEKSVTFTRHETCSTCKGEGAKPGTKKIICPACSGQGQVYNSLGGFIRMAQTCSSCGGEGRIIAHPCPACSGQGLVRTRKNLTVKIPAGIKEDAYLRIRQEGHKAGGGSGDLYVIVHIRKHPLFRREANNLIHEKTISLTTAVLGADIEVPTLDGKVKMSIPAGTQPATVFRLKQKGLPDLHSQRRGDEFIKVHVEIPKKLSSRERALFEELAKLRGENPSAGGSFTDKIKKAFK